MHRNELGAQFLTCLSSLKTLTKLDAMTIADTLGAVPRTFYVLNIWDEEALPSFTFGMYDIGIGIRSDHRKLSGMWETLQSGHNWDFVRHIDSFLSHILLQMPNVFHRLLHFDVIPLSPWAHGYAPPGPVTGTGELRGQERLFH